MDAASKKCATDEGNPKTSEDDCITAKLEKSTRLPDKMMRILLSDEAPDAIWWLPKGESFAIQKDKFEGDILMKHFRGNKFKSLVRNLHRWGFRRTTFDGDATGKTVAFSHPNFRKGMPELVFRIEMTNEINKGKKQEQKSALGKRQSAALEGDEALRLPPRQKPLMPSTATPQSLADSHGQQQKTKEVEVVSQPRGAPPPTMQSFALNAASLRTDQFANLLTGGGSSGLSPVGPYASLRDAATMQALRATRDIRFGSTGSSLEVNQQLRDQYQSEQNFLNLLRAPNHALLQRQLSNSLQNGVLPRSNTNLNPSLLPGSPLGALFNSTASGAIPQPHATMQELLRRQQLHENLLQGPGAAPSASNLFQGANDTLQPPNEGFPKPKGK